MRMSKTITDQLFAPCGINCMLCHHHCENSEPCEGCRGGKGKSKHCQNCEMLQCVNAKNLHFCFECTEFPCGLIIGFNQMYIDRYGHEFLPNAYVLRDYGKEALTEKIRTEWSCTKCGGVICIHDNCCSECKTLVE